MILKQDLQDNEGALHSFKDDGPCERKAGHIHRIFNTFNQLHKCNDLNTQFIQIVKPFVFSQRDVANQTGKIKAIRTMATIFAGKKYFRKHIESTGRNFSEDITGNQKDSFEQDLLSCDDENEEILPICDEDDEVFVETQKQHWKNVISRPEFDKLKKRSKSSSSSSSRSRTKDKSGRTKSSNRLPSEVSDSSSNKRVRREADKIKEAKKVIEIMSKKGDAATENVKSSNSIQGQSNLEPGLDNQQNDNTSKHDALPELMKLTEAAMNDKNVSSSQSTLKENKGYSYIPLQILSDPTGTEGAWRGWSCIWLAHLMREAVKSSVLISDSITKLRNKSIEEKSKIDGKLKKRGKYDTRREGKYWWKTSSEDAWNLLRADKSIFI